MELNNCFRTIRTLLVDDSPVIVAALKGFLATQPYIELIGVASSGDEAMRFLAQSEPDLILIDVHLPGSNGLETTRLIRLRWPRTRVILMSGFYKDLSQIWPEVGASGYIYKPQIPVRFIEIVKPLFAGSENRTICSGA